MKKTILINLLLLTLIIVKGQGVWTQKANFGGGNRGSAVGFSIGTKGYIGTGWMGTDLSQDFWEWDQATNVWTQKADFGGGKRIEATGFSVGTKGYLGTGRDSIGNEYDDLWEWDQATNIWTQKANLPLQERTNAVGLSSGNKGYIGTGETFSVPEYNDLWEFDPSTNTWANKAPMSTIRGYACGFSIGTKLYIGMGDGDFSVLYDFWEWDQQTNTWTQKANFSGGSGYALAAFSIGNRGYFGTGNLGGPHYFWEWNQETNTWTHKADFGGGQRFGAIGFSIGTKGYFGIGDGTSGITNDFWEYAPDTVSYTGINELSNSASTINVYPNPTNGKFTLSYLIKNNSEASFQLIDVSGKIVFHQPLNSGLQSLILDPSLNNGTYYWKIISDNVVEGIGKIVVIK